MTTGDPPFNLCTCYRPWFGVVPPPPCPVHGAYNDEFYGYFQTAPAREPWVCPRCNTVNAPHVDKCCQTPTYIYTTTTGTGVPYTTTTFDESTSDRIAEVPGFSVTKRPWRDSWIYCNHSNETVMKCICAEDCICRSEGSCNDE